MEGLVQHLKTRPGHARLTRKGLRIKNPPSRAATAMTGREAEPNRSFPLEPQGVTGSSARLRRFERHDDKAPARVYEAVRAATSTEGHAGMALATVVPRHELRRLRR